MEFSFQKIENLNYQKQVKSLLKIVSLSVIYKIPFSINAFSVTVRNDENISYFELYKNHILVCSYFVNYKNQNYKLQNFNTEEAIQTAYLLSLCLDLEGGWSHEVLY